MSSEEPRPAPPRRRALTPTETAALTDSIAALLGDASVTMTAADRGRWVGALTVLEIVLGRRPSQVSEKLGESVRRLL